MAGCLYSSILKGTCWQPHLIKGCGSLTFHVEKDCHSLTQTFFFSRSVQGEDIGIQICGCYCEQMSPLASKGNGTSRPTLTPGAKQHTTTGLQRGQEAGGTASTSECFARLPSTLLFPSLQLSSKNICLLFLWHPPLTSVLASPWPILSIVVDVMTKNKQCEGVRLPFVWAGRSPRRCREEGYHPTNTAASSSHSQLLTGTWTPTSASVVDQMQSGVDRLALFPGF